MSGGRGRRFAPWLVGIVAMMATATAQDLGGDIRLTADDGRVFSLEEVRGNVVLLAFGYTHCPDICPTTLAQLRQVIQALGKDADNVRVIFVTLDPLRDTADHLHRYVKYFDQRFIGLTGSVASIDEVARSYGVRYEIHRDTSVSIAYSVDHNTDIYILDQRGELSAIVPYGTPTGGIKAFVRELLMTPTSRDNRTDRHLRSAPRRSLN